MLKLISYTKLEKEVSTMIKVSRFEHSLRVKETAVKLAKVYAPSLEIAASYVGIFHDAYRYLSGEECLEICQKAKLEIFAEEIANPMLLHGAVAALNFASVAGPCPLSFFKAMRYHTLGNIDMGVLGAILYVADYIEPGRTHLTDSDREDILAVKKLEAIVLNIVNREFEYSAKIEREVATSTSCLRTYLQKGGKFD